MGTNNGPGWSKSHSWEDDLTLIFFLALKLIHPFRLWFSTLRVVQIPTPTPTPTRILTSYDAVTQHEKMADEDGAITEYESLLQRHKIERKELQGKKILLNKKNT